METALGWNTHAIEVVQFLLILGLVIAGPTVLVDWWRKRNEATIRHQIALTDAIYERFGAIASPILTAPLWGPRRILLAVRPGAVNKALVAAHEVFSAANRMKLGRYEIVLTLPEESVRKAQETDAVQPPVARPWETKAAA